MQDAAEGNVGHFGFDATTAGDLEEFAEVQLLRGADNVPDFRRALFMDPVIDGGEVGGGIVKPAV